MTTKANFISEQEQNVRNFLSVARDIQRDKIRFSRDAITDERIKDTLLYESSKYLGDDAYNLKDGTDARVFIHENFGLNYLYFFENSEGILELDMEHALVFYYRLLDLKNSEADTEKEEELARKVELAKGLVYFMAAYQLEDEFESIKKVITKGLISPTFQLSPKLFGWKRCPSLMRKYASQLYIPEGFKAYQFEINHACHKAYLANEGFSLEEATANVPKDGGLLFTYLPTDIEEALLPYILQGGFSDRLMDGYYKQSYMTETERIAEKVNVDETYNVYARHVKPLMVELLGVAIGTLQHVLKENTLISPKDVVFYHISPQRVCLLIRDTFTVEEAFPEVYPLLTPVEPFSIEGLLEGKLL